MSDCEPYVSKSYTRIMNNHIREENIVNNSNIIFIVNNYHKYYCDKEKRLKVCGFPINNNPSIVSSTSSQVEDFNCHIQGYRDTPYYYQYTDHYGEDEKITKRCDLFYRTHKGEIIDYITLRGGRQYVNKVRVRCRCRRVSDGKYFLKLDIL